MFLLTRYKFTRILDVGCGTGKFSSCIQQATGARVTGLDISPTAILKATKGYPQIKFCAAAVPSLPFRSGTFDLVAASELIWSILPVMTDFFTEVRRILVNEGKLMILQQFYQHGQQKYGLEVMRGPKDLMALLPFRIEELVELSRFSNHHTIILAKAR